MTTTYPTLAREAGRLPLRLEMRRYMWRHHRRMVLAGFNAQEQVFWADLRQVLDGGATGAMAGDPFIRHFTGQMRLW